MTNFRVIEWVSVLFSMSLKIYDYFRHSFFPDFCKTVLKMELALMQEFEIVGTDFAMVDV